MFGYSHLPFSTSFTPVFNGETETFTLFIEQSQDLDFHIKQLLNFNFDITQNTGLDFYIEEEENVEFTIDQFPRVIL